MSDYLIIVQYDIDCDIWVVHEDSWHILDSGGNTQELRVRDLVDLPQRNGEENE